MPDPIPLDPTLHSEKVVCTVQGGTTSLTQENYSGLNCVDKNFASNLTWVSSNCANPTATSVIIECSPQPNTSLPGYMSYFYG